MNIVYNKQGIGILIIFVLLKIKIAGSSINNTMEPHHLEKNVLAVGYFSNKFYQTLAPQSTENVIASPAALHIILSLISKGADGETRKQLEEILYISKKDSVSINFSEVKNLENIAISIANAIYVHNDFLINENFIKESITNYNVLVKNINFMESDNSAEQINEWIFKNTKGKISNVINPDHFSEESKIMILNALYFKSNWRKPFNTQLTEKKIFYNLNGKESIVEMMIKKEELSFGNCQDFDANLVKLQYLNENFEMIILLPNKMDGLTQIEQKFDWNKLISASFSAREIELYLPKFKFETTFNLKDSIEQIGADLMFGKKANFTKISSEPLYVSQILQKIYIDVNEEGSEAATATVAQIRTRRMIVEREEFVVDRPFMFAINYKTYNVPLFIGSIRNLQGLTSKDEL